MNEGNTGGNQPILQPLPQVSAASVAPIVENITDKYADLKRTVHDFIVTLPEDSPCRESSWISLLSELVGLKEDSGALK